jgi:hypothetical protein
LERDIKRTRYTLAFAKYRETRELELSSSEEEPFVKMSQPIDNTTQDPLRLILDKLQKTDEFNRRQFEILSKENQRRDEEIKKLSNALQMTMISEDGS